MFVPLRGKKVWRKVEGCQDEMTDCLTHFQCTNGGDKYVISSADSTCTCLFSSGYVRCWLTLDDIKIPFIETFKFQHLHYWDTFLFCGLYLIISMYWLLFLLQRVNWNLKFGVKQILLGRLEGTELQILNKQEFCWGCGLDLKFRIIILLLDTRLTPPPRPQLELE